MNDNRNHIGPNWTGRPNRTLADAYPMTHGTASYPKIDRLALRRELIEQNRKARIAQIVDVLMLAVFILVMWSFTKAPVIWQWLQSIGLFTD